jgi:hypothetical protein
MEIGVEGFQKLLQFATSPPFQGFQDLVIRHVEGVQDRVGGHENGKIVVIHRMESMTKCGKGEPFGDHKQISA